MQSTAVSFVEADIPSSDTAAAAAAAAAAINSLRAHAAVHLDGHNGDSLIAAFALRPALLQVNGPVLSTLFITQHFASRHALAQAHYRFISTAAAAFLPLYITDAVVAPVECAAPLTAKACTSDHKLQVRFCSIHGEIDSPSTLLPSQSSSGTHLIPPALRPCARRQRRVLSRASQVAPAPAAVAAYLVWLLAVLIFVSGARLLRATASRPPPPCLQHSPAQQSLTLALSSLGWPR
jgi:hypothetical protein